MTLVKHMNLHNQGSREQLREKQSTQPSIMMSAWLLHVISVTAPANGSHCAAWGEHISISASLLAASSHINRLLLLHVSRRIAKLKEMHSGDWVMLV